MRKFFISILFILVSYQLVSSQILIALVFGDKLNSEKLEFGLNVGENISTISNVGSKKYQYGLNLGMTFVFKLNDRFYVNPALYFSYPMGARDLPVYETADSNLNIVLSQGSVQRKLSYFSLPVTVRYRLFGLTFLELGPQISLNNNAVDIFTVGVGDNGEVQHTEKIRDNYKYFDAGVTFGFTQKLRAQNGVSISFRYYQGLVDISNIESQPNQKNSVYYFSVGIPIGGNKKAKVQE